MGECSGPLRRSKRTVLTATEGFEIVAMILYRLRIVGQKHVPFRGPALLFCNDMSYVNGLLVGACVQRFIPFMVYKPFYQMKAFHWLLCINDPWRGLPRVCVTSISVENVLDAR